MDEKNLFLPILSAAKEAEENLISLLDRVDSEAALSVMIAQLLITTPERSFGDTIGSNFALIEILAKFCIPRFGNNQGITISAQDSSECYGFLRKCLYGNMFSRHGSESPNSIIRSLKMRSEVVRGSAYPEQNKNKILQLQGRFDLWFENKIGISPSRAIEIVFAINQCLGNTYNDNKKSFYESGREYKERFSSIKKIKNRSVNEDRFIQYLQNKKNAEAFGFLTKRNEVIPHIFPINIEDLSLDNPANTKESEALKKLIGVTKKSYTEDIEIQRHPLYGLNSGKILLPDLSNCLDVLWDAFEDVAKSDQNFFDNKYQKHKSKWLEKEGASLLKKIFPSDSVFETLDYPDPDNPRGSAELDIAIKWGPFLLLTEAKAKQFRFESIRGDAGRLRTDIKNNVEDAYQQSLRAMRYIESTEEPIFTERSSGRILKFKKEEISLIYPFSLSLNHLSDIATELNKTREFGLFSDNKYPFSICLADLELILKSEITPDIFLHYIKKRLEILSAKEEWNGDELDLFGGYLDCRLDMKNIPDFKKDHNLTHISFGGYSSDFDRLMSYERGEISEKPRIRLSLPDEVLAIFDQLRKFNDDGARRIAFALLDLDNSLLSTIAETIRELKNTKIENGRFRVCAFSNDEVVVSISGSSSATLAELIDRTGLRSSIEKYRRKLRKSVSFGILCRGKESDSLFDTAQYTEYDWLPNPEFDQILKEETSWTETTPSSKTGRNDKCPCGSGKKFKKCHLIQ